MNDNVLIRELRPDDSITSLTELLHAAYAPLARMGFRYLATHQDHATTAQRCQRGFPFVAELNGRLIGTLTLSPPPLESECSWYLQTGVYSIGQFAIAPDLQRQGLGSRLLQFAEQQARSHGATELALDTAEGATHLIQWYKRLGFRFIEYVSWQDTNYRSVVLSKFSP